MEPDYGSRKSEETAAEKTAGTGGNGTKESTQGGRPQSGAPRSWRQYIEETLPAQDSRPEAEQKSRKARLSDADRRERILAARARCARWARERAGRLRSAAAASLERLSDAAGTVRERLGSAAGAARKNLGPGAEKVRSAVARHPISPLLYVTLLAVLIGVAAFHGSYARAYVLEVNGQKVGIVSDEDEVNAILRGLDCDVEVTLSPVYAAPSDLTDAAQVESALIEEMGAHVSTVYNALIPMAADAGGDSEPVLITAWAISVDGVEMAVAASKDEIYRMLDEVAQPWLPESAVRYEFVEDVQVYPVELPQDTVFDDLDALREELSALRVEKAVYVVQKGNTFNRIAYSLGMKPYELAALNPDVIVDKLFIGQELIIQQAVPRLSVIAIAEETYEEAIPSPVEYIETADMYKGDTKVKTQGSDGLARVSAQVTYINNQEMARDVLESTTLVEPTTTYTYTGTTPRPTTASKGYFIWPVKGTITSRFGYRYIFGRTDFHSGLDIAVPYGTTIKAADGGTVIKAGWEGSYGNLVAIRHDNGIVTYYGHNSSILVKVGDKVYQGQAIARAGSTGNSTGNHCHFEVRVNGTSVNPRNYLS